MRKQPTEWEKIFANDMFDKRLIYEIYKELIQIKIKKENPIKNRQKIWIDIFSKKIYMKQWNNAQRAILQGNADQNQMRYHLTTVRMASIKKTTNNKFWQGCGE